MAEKILIADDDPETLRLVSLMLQRQGYEIVTAANGNQALGMTRTELPDLIILDVMMPDLDGYEVARQIRKQTDTANIPILMFTAKSQVEDKVTGYESGADDYLTKPVHPAELQAHIRALLSRAKTRIPTTTERGHLIGLLGAKGGVGVSTLALNLAIAFARKTKKDVIAMEMKPGQGTWGVELGLADSLGLANLLRLKPAEITPVTVDNHLVRTTYGIRLLLSSIKLSDVETMASVPQLEIVLQQLTTLAQFIFLDIGNSSLPGLDMILKLCNEVFVVTEGQPIAIQRTKQLITDLGNYGFGKSKLLSLAVINRVRSDIQLNAVQVQESLGIPLTIVIPPAPEQSFQAASRNVPMTLLQQDGLASQQFLRLVEQVSTRLVKE